MASTTLHLPVITPGCHLRYSFSLVDLELKFDFMVRPRIESGPSKLVGRHHTHGSIKPHNLLRPNENVNLSYKKKAV